MKDQEKRTKCELCPNKLGTCDPSPMALERIHAMQAESANSKRGRKKKNSALAITSGCDWYINSAEHGYCFWSYAKELDETVPDKEICRLLCITQAQLRETFNSAISKLRENKDDPVIKEFIEHVLDFSANRKYDGDHLTDEAQYAVSDMTLIPVYEDYGSESKTEDQIQDEIDAFKSGKVKKKRGRKPKSSMPRHRDGRKTDLYGLYSDPEKQKEQMEKYKKKREEEENG